MERHMILCLGRSGSNTLADLLNQHPDILNVGEVLGDWTMARRFTRSLGLFRGDDAAYLDAVTRPSLLLRGMNGVRNYTRWKRGRSHRIKHLRDLHSVGFKDFSTLMVESGLRYWLVERPDVKVIGLVRDDLLDRLVSWQVLERTGLVTSHGGRLSGERTIEIDPGRIEALLERIEDENRLLQEMLDELPQERVRVVTYDELFRDEATRDTLMREMFTFLGVRPLPTEVRMKKIIRVPAAEMIANREACEQALEGTRFEGVLSAAAG